MSKFFKKYEVYSPQDLLWLEVFYDAQCQEITILNKNNDQEISICDGSLSQLDEFIGLLQMLRTKFPTGEEVLSE